MKYMPANRVRAIVGLVALLNIFVGAGILWGFGGALLTFGLFVAFDCSVDETVERITNTTRFEPAQRAPQESDT